MLAQIIELFAEALGGSGPAVLGLAEPMIHDDQGLGAIREAERSEGSGAMQYIYECLLHRSVYQFPEGAPCVPRFLRDLSSHACAVNHNTQYVFLCEGHNRLGHLSRTGLTRANHQQRCISESNQQA